MACSVRKSLCHHPSHYLAFYSSSKTAKIFCQLLLLDNIFRLWSFMYRVFLKLNETTVGMYSVHNNTETNLCVNMGLWMLYFLPVVCLKKEHWAGAVAISTLQGCVRVELEHIVALSMHCSTQIKLFHPKHGWWICIHFYGRYMHDVCICWWRWCEIPGMGLGLKVLFHLAVLIIAKVV